MDLSTSIIPIKEKEYRALTQLIYEKSGINLGDNKHDLLKTRLGKRLRALGIRSYTDYYNLVVNSPDDGELMLMINAISTNFTSFFREKQHFDFLDRTVLPEIVEKKRRATLRLRAWCAAAASGEEPYSLALTLMEFFEGLPAWDVKLLATDISTKVLTKAVEGVYEAEKVATVDPQMRQKYFDVSRSGEEKIFTVKHQVKELITFRRLNLMDDQFPFTGPFDFIFCRNVLIYFDPPTQEAVFRKLLRYLCLDGFLLIGHTENISPSLREYVKVLAPATYRKIKHL